MKKRSVFLTVALMLFTLSAAASADETTPAKGPKAVLAETQFEFQPVLEETQVTHKFILKNVGDKPLTILDVKSG